MERAFCVSRALFDSRGSATVSGADRSRESKIGSILASTLFRESAAEEVRRRDAVGKIGPRDFTSDPRPKCATRTKMRFLLNALRRGARSTRDPERRWNSSQTTTAIEQSNIVVESTILWDEMTVAEEVGVERGRESGNVPLARSLSLSLSLSPSAKLRGARNEQAKKQYNDRRMRSPRVAYVNPEKGEIKTGTKFPERVT